VFAASVVDCWFIDGVIVNVFAASVVHHR
jgi:hypothetical protein